MRASASAREVEYRADPACLAAENDLRAYQQTPKQQAARRLWCGVGMLISASMIPATVRQATDVMVVSKDHGSAALLSGDCVLAINGISTKLLTISEVKALIKVQPHLDSVCM